MEKKRVSKKVTATILSMSLLTVMAGAAIAPALEAVQHGLIYFLCIIAVIIYAALDVTTVLYRSLSRSAIYSLSLYS